MAHSGEGEVRKREAGPGVVPNELDYAAAIDAEWGIKKE